MSAVIDTAAGAKSPTTGRWEVGYSLAMIERARKRLMYRQKVVEKLRAVGAPRSLAVAIDILAVMEAKLDFLVRQHHHLLAETCNGQQMRPKQNSRFVI